MRAIRELLYLHWRAARWIVAPFVLISLGLPMFVLRAVQITRKYGMVTPNAMLHAQTMWLPFFPLLAMVVGGIVAITAWSWDHQARHVYALSLPMKRSEYAISKFVAGLGILLIPLSAALVGVVLGVVFTKLPVELHAYPFSFAFRFALAALISYSVAFAMAASTVRTTAIIMIGAIVIMIFGSLAVQLLNDALNTSRFISPSELIYTAFMTWPGPFAVFGGSWAIIDV